MFDFNTLIMVVLVFLALDIIGSVIVLAIAYFNRHRLLAGLRRFLDLYVGIPQNIEAAISNLKDAIDTETHFLKVRLNLQRARLGLCSRRLNKHRDRLDKLDKKRKKKGRCDIL